MKIANRSVGLSRRGEWAGVIRRDREKVQPWKIVPSGEYHTFSNRFAEGESELWEGDISPDGTVLALAASDGVRLWDIPQGREICRLSTVQTMCAMFRASGRELLTCGPGAGLQRWKVPEGKDPTGNVKIGLVDSIALPFAPRRMARGHDDRKIALVGEGAGQSILLDLSAESVRPEIMSHPSAGFVAVNPNADRIATSGWHTKVVKLWDGKSGTLIKQLEGDLASRVFFTPQDELIVARSLEFTFHALDTLAVTRRMPRESGLYAGHIAFTTDGKLMAMEMAPGVIHLKEVTSGRTVAKLEDPNNDVSEWMGFTPDGTQLIVVSRFAQAIHRWDFRAIRSRLKTMNLDWDWPEFAASPPVEISPSNGSRPGSLELP